jgi:DNA helicase-2/ATP-dependent DNA helicase PcrA
MFEAIDFVILRGQAKESLLKFKKIILDLKEAFDEMEDLYQLMPVLMSKTGYMDMLKLEDSESSEDRMDNLKELQSVFTRGDIYYEGTFYDKLNQQLDQIALYSDLDQDVAEDNHVKLATYHQVKGLEFKIVFMVVMEEGIFPNDRALMSTYELEEERRVAYVGITRAKERLYMTYAERRMVYGQTKMGYPSRFLKESRLNSEVPKEQATYVKESHLLKTGDHVDHQVFGRGVVVSVDQDIATIAFAMPYGIKNLLESHPAIKKVKK